MVDELTSGTAIAMEIKSDNAHARFREFVGPHDPVSIYFFFINLIRIYSNLLFLKIGNGSNIETTNFKSIIWIRQS